MTEPTPAAEQGEQHLLGVMRDPEADPAQRVRAATTLAQLAHRYTPGAKGNAAAGLGDLVGLVVQLVQDHVKLKRLVLELQARPAMTYEGVWDAQKAYNRGSFVTHQGSLWHCEDTNVGVRPGAGSSSWRLAVQRGRDGNRGR